MTSHPYTCLCCALAFTTPQTQRTHYTTDLHRYNSKRAVAGLTPVDITTFNQKFNKEEQQQQQQQQPASDSYHCQPCHKSFSSLAAHNNHLLSKKHQLNLAKPSPIQNHKVEEPNQDTPITHNKANLQQLIEQRIQQAPKIQPNECLFCPRSVSLRFPNPEHALKHMLSAHGFFLPDQEYLVDKLGLLAYMAEVVAVWNRSQTYV
ncbi:hypothetical protein VP01_3381g2 [Puccinia sorghi]|uniref:C2H2-type domain-containing protein n=1 Tax=Puccinia sorghi TaxID=27349 RepID=A0A0L6UWU3_9BASI|nr:hypothetical protein VP01_3381g2 [Puccinia sorghi]